MLYGTGGRRKLLSQSPKKLLSQSPKKTTGDEMMSSSCSKAAVVVLKYDKSWNHQPDLLIWIKHTRAREVLEEVRAKCLHNASVARLTKKNNYFKTSEDHYEECVACLLEKCKNFLSLQKNVLRVSGKTYSPSPPTGLKALACSCRTVYQCALPSKIRSSASLFTWREAQITIDEVTIMYNTMNGLVNFIEMYSSSIYHTTAFDIFSQIKIMMHLVCGSNFIRRARPSILDYLNIGGSNGVASTMTLSRNQTTGKNYGCLVVQEAVVVENCLNKRHSLSFQDDSDDEKANVKCLGSVYKRLRLAAF